MELAEHLSNNECIDVIEFKNVTKIYSKHKGLKKNINKQIDSNIKAVDDVSFSVKQGEIFGILGANGAGKTTLIKILCGLVKPTCGDIKVFGLDVLKNKEEILKQVGAIVEAPTLFKEMTGFQNLEYLAMLQGGLDKQRLIDIIKIVGLEDRMHSKFSTYSLGMQQRLGIAQAIMHNPKLLILDEPINGLDPSGIIEIRELLRKICNQYGTTIFISSHILSEMQMLCDRVGIMVEGKIAAIKTMEEIEQSSGEKTIACIECDNVELAAELLSKMEDIEVRVANQKVYVRFSGDKTAQINKELVLNNVLVKSITLKKRTLEDVYKELAK